VRPGASALSGFRILRNTFEAALPEETRHYRAPFAKKACPPAPEGNSSPGTNEVLRSSLPALMGLVLCAVRQARRCSVGRRNEGRQMEDMPPSVKQLIKRAIRS